MIIEKEIIVNKNIADAWKVLGTEFADAHKWATVINHSEGSGAEFNGATCSERGCDLASMGPIKEKLLKFSNEHTELSYQIYAGLPSMVAYAENNWKLVSLGQNKSRLEMKMKIETKGLMGAIMKPMMKMNFSKMGKGLTEEFKYYVENGKPHPKKLKAMKKR